MKNKKFIKELEKRGIKTIEELIDALNKGVSNTQKNIEKGNKDIEYLKAEIASKQEKIEKNKLLREKGVEALQILNGY